MLVKVVGRAGRPSTRGSAPESPLPICRGREGRAASRSGRTLSEGAVPFPLLSRDGYGNALTETEAAVGADDAALGA